MSARCAICLAADAGYLLPTLVASAQARHFASAALADVFVFVVGLDHDAFARAQELCYAAGVRLLRAKGVDNAMMARLRLHEMLPEPYSALLYLDADVQVLASLDPLLAASVPPGHLRAVLDPMALRVRAGGRDGHAMAARMAAAGIPPAQHRNYVNSGVLHVSLDGWERIAAAARGAVRQGSFPDQDALNIAAAGCTLPLSLAWNFPAFLLNAGIDRRVAPAILHFMSQPKPWDGAFPPWSRDHSAPYRELARREPTLAPPPMPAMRRLRYAIQQRLKRMVEARTWGCGALLAAVLAAEEEARCNQQAPGPAQLA